MALSKPKAKYVRETRASLIESMVGEYEKYQELLKNNVKYQTWKEDSVYVKFRVYYTLNDEKLYTTIKLEGDKFDLNKILDVMFRNETNLIFNGVEILKMEKIITNYKITETYDVENFKFKYGYYNRADSKIYRDDIAYYSNRDFEKAKANALKFYDQVFSNEITVYFRNYSFSGVFPSERFRTHIKERETKINNEELKVREDYKPNMEWVKYQPFTDMRLRLPFAVWNVFVEI